MNNSPHCALRIGCKEKYVEETGKRHFFIYKCIPTSNGGIISIKRFVTYVQHFMQVGGCSTSATLTLSDQLFTYFSLYNKVCNNFGAVFCQTVERYLLDEGKMSDFWLVQDLELHVELFKKLDILPVSCQYIFSLINFILRNKENFQTNSSLHSFNTTNKHNFHRQNVNLSCFERSTF